MGGHLAKTGSDLLGEQQKEGELQCDVGTSFKNIVHVTQTDKDAEDDEGYQTEACSRSKISEDEKAGAVKRIVVGDKIRAIKIEENEDKEEKPKNMGNVGPMTEKTNKDAIYASQDVMEKVESTVATESSEVSEKAFSDGDKEQDSKPRWEINYDAFYASQDDIIEEVDDDALSAKLLELTNKTSDDITEVGNNATETETSELTNETSIAKISHNAEGDQEDEKHVTKPKWEVNYDANYVSHDDVIEDVDDYATTESTKSINDTHVTLLNSKYDESDHDQKGETVDPRWEFNYDADYASQADDAEEVDNPITTDSSELINETHQTTEHAESDPEVVKPKWEFNYDAIYASQDDVIEDVDNVVTTYVSELTNNTTGEEVDEETPKRWGENYDSLYELQSDNEEGTKTEEIEEETPKRWGENYDSLYELESDTVEKTETGEEVDEETPKRWGENYDSLYELQSDNEEK